MDHPQKNAHLPLLLALACGANVESAARQTGLTERTVHKRLKDPAFRRQILAIRRDMVNRASGAMSAAAMESIKTLLELQRPSQPGTVRLGACRAMLEIGLKLREVTDIEEEVAQLRQLVTAAQGHNTVLQIGPATDELPGDLDDITESSEGVRNGARKPPPNAA
jgi:hypothetical protein